MKLIIDIPEEAKQAFDKAESNDLKGGYYDHGGVIGKAIQNGIPLDDVKAEIEKQIERDFAFSETETLKVPCHYGIANGLQNAIRFLDNIGSEVKLLCLIQYGNKPVSEMPIWLYWLLK